MRSVSSTIAAVVKWDLADSRSLEDRTGFERALDDALKELVQEVEPGWWWVGWPEQERAWMREPGRTAGIDEVTAVARTPAVLVEATLVLNALVWPHRFRAGVGFGEIDIGGKLAEMDGPAFHSAREAIDRARSEDILLALELGDSPAPSGQRLLEGAANAWGRFVAGWTEREYKAVMAYREQGTQVAAAKHLGMTQQGVADALKRANFDTILHLEEAMRGWIWERSGRMSKRKLRKE